MFSPFLDSPDNPRKRRVATSIIISSSDESESEAEYPSPSLARKGSSQRMGPLPAYVVDRNEYAERGTEPPPPRCREAYASRTTPPDKVLAESSDMVFLQDLNPLSTVKAEPPPSRIATGRVPPQLPPVRQLPKFLVESPYSHLVKKTAEIKGSRLKLPSMSLFENGLQAPGLRRYSYIEQASWWTTLIVSVRHVWLNDRSGPYLSNAEMPSSSSTSLETTSHCLLT